MKIPRKRTSTSGFDMNGCIACPQDLSVWSDDTVYVIIGDAQRIKRGDENMVKNFSLK
jgi:hypothetical protein